MGKRVSSTEYQRVLDEAGDEMEQEAEQSRFEDLIAQRLESLGVVEGDDSVGEAIAFAAAAEAPKRKTAQIQSLHGKPLNKQQMAFCQGVIEGKSKRQAYRDAYPNLRGSDATASASAHRLSQDPRVKAIIASGWEETTEALAEDMAAQRRYVARALVALSKGAKQEGSRLRALELLGRAAGMFRDQQAQTEKPVTAEELRRELAGHLKLVAKG
jgi:hypothetical protein